MQAMGLNGSSGLGLSQDQPAVASRSPAADIAPVAATQAPAMSGRSTRGATRSTRAGKSGGAKLMGTLSSEQAKAKAKGGKATKGKKAQGRFLRC